MPMFWNTLSVPSS